MSYLFWITAVVFGIVAVGMVLIILVQRPQGGGLAGAFGGAGGSSTETVFGGRVGDALTWATVIAFSVYLALAITLNLLDTASPAPATTPPPVAAKTTPAPAPTEPTESPPATGQRIQFGDVDVIPPDKSSDPPTGTTTPGDSTGKPPAPPREADKPDQPPQDTAGDEPQR